MTIIHIHRQNTSWNRRLEEKLHTCGIIGQTSKDDIGSGNAIFQRLHYLCLLGRERAAQVYSPLFRPVMYHKRMVEVAFLHDILTHPLIGGKNCQHLLIQSSARGSTYSPHVAQPDE